MSKGAMLQVPGSIRHAAASIVLNAAGGRPAGAAFAARLRAGARLALRNAAASARRSHSRISAGLSSASSGGR